MTDKTVSLPEERRHGSFIKNNLRNYGMLMSLIAIMLFFQVMTGGTLLQPLNLTNLVLQNSYIVIMALGMLLVIVTGHIDLSVGSVAGFVGAVAAVLMVTYKIDYTLAFIACLLLGAAIGAAQGYWVAFFGIPSFIVTLAGMLVFKGLALAVLQGQSLGPFPATFQKLSSGFLQLEWSRTGARYSAQRFVSVFGTKRLRRTIPNLAFAFQRRRSCWCQSNSARAKLQTPRTGPRCGAGAPACPRASERIHCLS
nr:hypothetical protein [Bradyrhizobium sp. CCBAU 15544]